MNATLTIKQVVAKVRNSVKPRAHDDNYVQRFSEAALPGERGRQGDVYIKKLAELPKNLKRTERPQAQVTVGTSKGQRHVLDSLEGITFYELPNPTVLEGPILHVTQERVLTHPEHSHVVLTPGVYQITYQRAKGQTLRRSVD